MNGSCDDGCLHWLVVILMVVKCSGNDNNGGMNGSCDDGCLHWLVVILMVVIV